MRDEIKEALGALPDAPGVYLMYNNNDEVIYVGKAISLKKRVRSYFTNTGNHTRKVAAMVQHIVRFEYIIVANEVEALVLESNLIKDKKPKYNILLRDDKSYPYILITAEKYPRVLKVRRVEKNKGEYFGPFPNAYAVNDLIQLFQEIFPLRTCNLNFDAGDRLERPCLNYHIGRCMGQCIGKGDEEEYLKAIESIRQFLKGKTKDLINLVEERMKTAARNLQFETAATYRDHLVSMQTLAEKQTVSSATEMDIDLIAMARSDRRTCVQIFFMRAGKIVEREHFIIDDDYKEKDSALMQAFLMQFYMDASYVPKEILVDIVPDDLQTIQEFLTERKGTKVDIRRPQRGSKIDLLETVRTNAQDMLKKHEQKIRRRERTKPLGLEQLEALLELDDLERIECYDISNVSGAQTVGSMIVFHQGEKNPKEYRKFKLHLQGTPNDVGSHKEMMTRRLKRGLQENPSKEKRQSGFGAFADLMFIDGGKGQVNAIEAVLRELGLSIPVAGLVKDQFHHTRGIIFQNQEYPLDIRTPLYRLLYAMQEEAHRFAISYHRKLRDNHMKKTVLDDVPGVGERRKQALLQHFKTIPAIIEATEEQLADVPTMNKKAAAQVYAHFHGGSDDGSKD